MHTVYFRTDAEIGPLDRDPTKADAMDFMNRFMRMGLPEGDGAAFMEELEQRMGDLAAEGDFPTWE